MVYVKFKGNRKYWHTSHKETGQLIRRGENITVKQTSHGLRKVRKRVGNKTLTYWVR